MIKEDDIVMEKETKYYFITYKPQDTRYMAYSAVIEGTPLEFAEEYRIYFFFYYKIF